MLQPSVSGVAVSLLMSGLTGHFEHILCVKLMPIIFEFGVLLFYCFYHQNITCLKRLAGMGIMQDR